MSYTKCWIQVSIPNTLYWIQYSTFNTRFWIQFLIPPITRYQMLSSTGEEGMISHILMEFICVPDPCPPHQHALTFHFGTRLGFLIPPALVLAPPSPIPAAALVFRIPWLSFDFPHFLFHSPALPTCSRPSYCPASARDQRERERESGLVLLLCLVLTSCLQLGIYKCVFAIVSDCIAFVCKRSLFLPAQH